MPLSDHTSAQIKKPRCILPVLRIGAREDSPLEDQALTGTEQGDVTSKHILPHIEVLEGLDGFFAKVVPATGWRRTPVGDQESVRFWGGDEVTRLYQSSQYELILQDYSLIPDDDYFPQDDYYYDYASQDIEKIFRLPFRWMIGLEQFEGYSDLSYYTSKGLCLPINPDGPQPSVTGENKLKGTKQTKIIVRPKFPNYTYV